MAERHASLTFISQAQMPVFNGENYGVWMFRLHCLLEERGCVEGAEKTLEECKEMSAEEKENFQKKNIKAKNIIVQSLSDKYIENIKGIESAKEMINKLKGLYERKSTLTSLFLRKKLLKMKCGPKDDLGDHFNNFDKIVSQLEDSGSKMNEQDKVCHLLLTMSDVYEGTITALETTNVKLTVDYVKSKLLDAELKVKNSEKTECAVFENAFMTRDNFKCYNCGERNHFARNCPKKTNNNNYRGNYRGRGFNRQGNDRGRGYQANIIEENNDYSLLAYSATAETNEIITFAIDSGATHNMINEKYIKYLSEVQDIPKINIRIANGETIQINKKGNLKVLSKEGYKLTIEVLVVKDLSVNLLSVRRLNKKNYEVMFRRNIASIKLSNQCKMFAKCDGSLFTIKFKIREGAAYKVTDVDLWHRRLGHLNHAGLKILGLPASNEICDICAKAKATRKPFQDTEKPRSREIGELIHSDIGGPINIETHRGEKYFLTIIDDYSHFTEVRLMKNKSEATNLIIEYIQRMKNQGTNVKRIRSDNGGEFQALERYCKSNGIIQEFTCSYTPQQNGVAERMNRTLMNRVRALLCESNLPKHLWGEAIMCATYTLNRSPTKALRGENPASIYLGKIGLERLRVFGSKAWVVNLPKKSKLEQRSKEMRMVGYATSGYRLWNPETEEIVISRDVTFDENDYIYQEIERKEEKTREVQRTVEYEYSDEDTDREQINEHGKDESREEEESENTEENIEYEQRPKRQSKLPAKLTEYDLHIAYALIMEEPQSYEEALQNGSEWKAAIDKEITSLEKLEVWSESDLPVEQKAIDTKWVFRTKQDGTKRARLVVRGFQQELDTLNNIYAPVAKMTTIRLGLSHAIRNSWEIRQLDIPTAFLNGYLETETYIKPPEGVKMTGSNKVLKLHKALYGLKESPKRWNETFNKFCEKIKMKRSKQDVCLYIGENIWLILFVDDIILLGKSENIQKTVKKLEEEFKAKDLGSIKNFLGIEIEKKEKTLKLSQQKFIEKVLEKFNMKECKTASTPMEYNFQGSNKSEKVITNIPYRELIGCLTYLCMVTRPDICYATSLLSRYLDCPTEELWKAAKRILKYLKKTLDKGLTYKKNSANIIESFSDADWAGDKQDRKSVSGMAIYHGTNLVSWASKKQQAVALSSAEAEYSAAALCTAELLYVKGLNEEFSGKCSAVLFCDSTSAIKMINNYENTKRSKHIDIKVHFVKDIVAKKLISVSYVDTKENVADILTKALCSVKFNYLREKLLG